MLYGNNFVIFVNFLTTASGTPATALGMSLYAARGVSVGSIAAVRLLPATAGAWRPFQHNRQTRNKLTSRYMHTNVIESTKHLGSFYRRPLPTPPCTAFSSAHGRVLFSEALAQGTAEAFFPLVEQFRTQDHPAYCGLASLAMVLNALQIDPGRTWKGAWRWFDESKLDCCKPLDRSVYMGAPSHFSPAQSHDGGGDVQPGCVPRALQRSTHRGCEPCRSNDRGGVQEARG